MVSLSNAGTKARGRAWLIAKEGEEEGQVSVAVAVEADVEEEAEVETRVDGDEPIQAC
jgi:hypothetical protein